MSDQTMMLPPLKLCPAVVAGVPVPLEERRFATYRTAFLTELLQWLAESKLSRVDVADQVEAIVSVIRQLHTIHQLDRCNQEDVLLTAGADQSKPRSIGEIVDEIIARPGSCGSKGAMQ